MSTLSEDIERRLREQAGLYVIVEEQDGALVLSGLVDTEDDRAAALDVVGEMAPGYEVDDDIEVSAGIPEQTTAGRLMEGGAGMFADAEADLDMEAEAIEPGDFTDQPIEEYGDYAAGPSSSFEEDEASDGDEVFVPPTDPVGTDREVIGGLSTTSMDEVDVEPSSDGSLGDEAIRDAILRELREDAMTTDLQIEVTVLEGLVTLTGTVPSIDSAESAEEVAARVPGVVEVDEELDVEEL
ncbi:MAG TPA: BON domain-containing protein [Dehalococcoidia bacterium]|nr:BON domain-containing protein [Dehalococcoidia bacterium]